jgi:hypothetical protein
MLDEGRERSLPSTLQGKAMEKFCESDEINPTGKPYLEFVYESDVGDPIPHPKMFSGKTAEAYRFILSAAQHGIACSPRDVSFNIDANIGIVHQAYNQLQKAGWKVNRVPTGRHTREKYVELVEHDGLKADEFRMLDLQFDVRTPPEDWEALRTDGDLYRNKARNKKGFTPPPLGVPVHITKLELVQGVVELTLDRKWTGELEKPQLLRIGDGVEVIGAGIAEDGPWLNTTQFTLRKVK